MRSFDDTSLEAEAVCRLVCRLTGRTVGVEYLWDTGDTSTLWFDRPGTDIERHPFITMRSNND